MLLKTERLTLTEYTIDDAACYFRLKSCSPVWRYSTYLPLNEAESGEALNKLVASAAQGLPAFRKLVLNATGEYVGEAGIIRHNKEAGRCVVGYNLLPEFWGEGYATEITKALVTYAFETLYAERVEALVQKENAASRRVLEKSGLVLEGVLRHYTKIGGKFADICSYSMLSDEYFTANPRRTGVQAGGAEMNEMDIRRIEYGSATYKAELMLRDKILRRPLGLDLFDEDLSGEMDDVHLGAFDGDKLIGVLVLTRVDGSSVRMRQVAVHDDWQNRGVGTALVAAAERHAASLGYSRITLHARQTATHFYEQLGYATEGEPFSEVGIPHRTMSKTLV